MKGKTGTSLQSIEYVPKKEWNRRCKDCKYLEIHYPKNQKSGRRGTQVDDPSGYWCSLTKEPRHYTSKVICNKFAKKAAEVRTDPVLRSMLEQRNMEIRMKELDKKRNKAKRKAEKRRENGIKKF